MAILVQLSFKKGDDIPENIRDIFYLTTDYINNKIGDETRHSLFGYEESKIDNNEQDEFFKKHEEMIENLKSGDILVTLYNVQKHEILNCSDVNILEKIVFRVFFPEAPITGDNLSLAQDVVKEYASMKETIDKLIKKGVFKSKDVRSRTFDDFVLRYYGNKVDDLMTKYSKAHKSDIRIKGTTAINGDANELVPHLFGEYLLDKGVDVMLSQVKSNDGRYRIFEMHKYQDDDGIIIDNESTFDGSARRNFGTLVALACLQDGIGAVDDNNGFYLREDELENVCKLVKKINEGKYVFKISTSDNGDDIVIKDTKGAVISVDGFEIWLRKPKEELKDNAGLQLQSET